MKTWGMETCCFLHASKTESCIYWSNFRLPSMNCFLYLDWMFCEWGLARVIFNTMLLFIKASCMLCKQSHVCDGQDSASKDWIILNTSVGCSVNEVGKVEAKYIFHWILQEERNWQYKSWHSKALWEHKHHCSIKTPMPLKWCIHFLWDGSWNPGHLAAHSMTPPSLELCNM